ncbi:Lutropin-choriogonadotropic hormone receptor [Liparis tanakae]|uniref:Lutropin-choriogonadotropic hormone receptor n=1 Tax=Liparis tanakae TaxID=230148 RepID=A0A4Z2GAX3_9TELE|nr:Lutropin-choriogonadotropic hormone receptor [Liparis tanakae]
MAPRAVWLLVALCGILNARSYRNNCPPICRCRADTFQCSRDTQLASRERATSGRLWLIQLPWKEVPTHAFKELIDIREIEISQSNQVTRINRHAFLSLHSLAEMTISNTGLTHFPDFTTISSLVPYLILEMSDNMNIDIIPANCFRGITEEYVVMDVSSTALSSLPTTALRGVRFLKATSAFALKTLPPVESLPELLVAELEYPSHCCAFKTWGQRQIELTADGEDLPDMEYLDLKHLPDCPKIPSVVKCTPTPDEFNPCEDLLGFPFLRWLTWIITVFAVIGNLAVLAMLLISHRKLTISRFLMCNLAFADLCMGLYLMLIAFMDHLAGDEYYNHATDWQTGPGCGAAGFLTVFASELSLYTLTVIGLERWHTIANAMHVDKRLRMRHVAVVMAAGWAFSLLVALLPLVGVSSYSKVSICLPMDIATSGSQLYVVTVLVLNVVAFLVVCACYISIYRIVRNPGHATRRGDTKIAKRMAVLIFTDFVCMAPISFFAISAALRVPLITVSHSKILLVVFYPINSLCNPFLYTLFTRAFRKDVCQLLSRCGCCHANTDFYRSHTLAGFTPQLDTNDSRQKTSVS